ncbi:MAG: NAD-dependent epimerase/dehydratase family protein [Planctomycetota bacterium]
MVTLGTTDVMLVTGGTGLVGSHMAEQARARGLQVRCLVRSIAQAAFLRSSGCELVEGDLDQSASLAAAVSGVTVVVHCAAKVGDWGPTEGYRRVNVEGTRSLLEAATATGLLKRWIQISSLGVYEGRDHYGTDEATEPSSAGIDGYTLTKVESERLVVDWMRTKGLPGVVLRPGFIYGERDRTVLPRLLERLQSGKFAYLGSPEKLMNNTWVGNLCHAVWLAIERDDVTGEVFNIRDPRLVTKKEFIETVCEAAGLDRPRKIVPIAVARVLARVLEGLWKLLGRQEAPILNSARLKFLGLNLDYSIDKAIRRLGYSPPSDFRDAMPAAVKACAQKHKSAGAPR